jgi:biotin-(acetyl-CoA carboxylase) ligase
MEVAGDPIFAAQQQATSGCDAGLVCYHLGANELSAAIVFAPDVALSAALTMLPVCGIGFQHALGSLAPPEVAVHLGWDGRIKVNGGRCGSLHVAASGTAPTETPDWLIVGLSLPLWPPSDDPGDSPEETTLYAEGCMDVDAVALLEAWVRHSLVWINRWLDGGVKPVHDEWRGLADGIGEEATHKGQTGTFTGVDEHFGMLLHRGENTDLIPLTTLLKDAND